ncbi:hypothetical protein AB4853_10425 [Bradyrhizobium sp. 1050_B9_N1_2]|uniref:hypothetical protein n=1 Tax=Bradyrhizobium sp. 1050_B9_N1_2 TaxID=3238688 RepID=UPI003EDBCCCF
MQALAAARMQEASPFGRWCMQRNVRALPAAPQHVAAFVRDCEPLVAMPKIWEAVQEISQSHLTNGFADPTAGGVVAEAINAIAKIDPPRSWPKAMHSRFLAQSWDVQSYIASRSKEQEAVVRRAQNEVAEVRRQLEAFQKPAEANHGTTEPTAH